MKGLYELIEKYMNDNDLQRLNINAQMGVSGNTLTLDESHDFKK